MAVFPCGLNQVFIFDKLFDRQGLSESIIISSILYSMLSQNELLHKYNTQVPRYTSYPTVPFWKEMIADQSWIESFQHNFHQQNSQEGISLYLHLPFCESLCTYCGCNKKITTNHSVEVEYINVILKEWKMYRKLMNEVPVIRELHLGGGTPTFFSPQHLQRLLVGVDHVARLIKPELDIVLQFGGDIQVTHLVLALEEGRAEVEIARI